MSSKELPTFHDGDHLMWHVGVVQPDVVVDAGCRNQVDVLAETNRVLSIARGVEEGKYETCWVYWRHYSE